MVYTLIRILVSCNPRGCLNNIIKNFSEAIPVLLYYINKIFTLRPFEVKKKILNRIRIINLR